MSSDLSYVIPSPASPSPEMLQEEHTNNITVAEPVPSPMASAAAALPAAEPAPNMTTIEEQFASLRSFLTSHFNSLSDAMAQLRLDQQHTRDSLIQTTQRLDSLHSKVESSSSLTSKVPLQSNEAINNCFSATGLAPPPTTTFHFTNFDNTPPELSLPAQPMPPRDYTTLHPPDLSGGLLASDNLNVGNNNNITVNTALDMPLPGFSSWDSWRPTTIETMVLEDVYTPTPHLYIPSPVSTSTEDAPSSTEVESPFEATSPSAKDTTPVLAPFATSLLNPTSNPSWSIPPFVPPARTESSPSLVLGDEMRRSADRLFDLATSGAPTPRPPSANADAQSLLLAPLGSQLLGAPSVTIGAGGLFGPWVPSQPQQSSYISPMLGGTEAVAEAPASPTEDFLKSSWFMQAQKFEGSEDDERSDSPDLMFSSHRPAPTPSSNTVPEYEVQCTIYGHPSSSDSNVSDMLKEPGDNIYDFPDADAPGVQDDVRVNLPVVHDLLSPLPSPGLLSPAAAVMMVSTTLSPPPRGSPTRIAIGSPPPRLTEELRPWELDMAAQESVVGESDMGHDADIDAGPLVYETTTRSSTPEPHYYETEDEVRTMRSPSPYRMSRSRALSPQMDMTGSYNSSPRSQSGGTLYMSPGSQSRSRSLSPEIELRSFVEPVVFERGRSPIDDLSAVSSRAPSPVVYEVRRYSVERVDDGASEDVETVSVLTEETQPHRVRRMSVASRAPTPHSHFEEDPYTYSGLGEFNASSANVQGRNSVFFSSSPSPAPSDAPSTRPQAHDINIALDVFCTTPESPAHVSAHHHHFDALASPMAAPTMMTSLLERSPATTDSTMPPPMTTLEYPESEGHPDTAPVYLPTYGGVTMMSNEGAPSRPTWRSSPSNSQPREESSGPIIPLDIQVQTPRCGGYPSPNFQGTIDLWDMGMPGSSGTITTHMSGGSVSSTSPRRLQRPRFPTDRSPTALSASAYVPSPSPSSHMAYASPHPMISPTNSLGLQDDSAGFAEQTMTLSQAEDSTLRMQRLENLVELLQTKILNLTDELASMKESTPSPTTESNAASGSTVTQNRAPHTHQYMRIPQESPSAPNMKMRGEPMSFMYPSSREEPPVIPIIPHESLLTLSRKASDMSISPLPEHHSPLPPSVPLQLPYNLARLRSYSASGSSASGTGVLSDRPSPARSVKPVSASLVATPMTTATGTSGSHSNSNTMSGRSIKSAASSRFPYPQSPLRSDSPPVIPSVMGVSPSRLSSPSRSYHSQSPASERASPAREVKSSSPPRIIPTYNIMPNTFGGMSRRQETKTSPMFSSPLPPTSKRVVIASPSPVVLGMESPEPESERNHRRDSMMRTGSPIPRIRLDSPNPIIPSIPPFSPMMPNPLWSSEAPSASVGDNQAVTQAANRFRARKRWSTLGPNLTPAEEPVQAPIIPIVKSSPTSASALVRVRPPVPSFNTPVGSGLVTSLWDTSIPNSSPTRPGPEGDRISSYQKKPTIVPSAPPKPFSIPKVSRENLGDYVSLDTRERRGRFPRDVNNRTSTAPPITMQPPIIPTPSYQISYPTALPPLPPASYPQQTRPRNERRQLPPMWNVGLPTRPTTVDASASSMMMIPPRPRGNTLATTSARPPSYY
ncbi:hypothetical protein DL93DRAFT_2165553 [Clavulina sp. PMI_390]|nr:hypothetical protein DL93DRAFT_2165553 [Clavulina sp. PMI_390]